MKIAIVGTHQVGKTTLAQAVHAELQDYTLLQEPYHDQNEAGIPTADDFIQQFNYSIKQVNTGNDRVIFDRCIIDILAYLHAVSPTLNIQSFFTQAQTAISTIDLFIFIPIEKPDIVTSSQVEMPKLRQAVNDLLIEWIDDMGIDALVVRGDIQLRLATIMNKLAGSAV
ncbi:AAA domain-containing protein [Chitinophaga skermanii]|uniref:AAA domain-containing protein n=1 Tax=Chitinophaga skermanii TaxID=331697 RepID=A0A327QXG9_9BACT|nr:ATP-binding protein [Chitinophaga skermanii]RAJ08655.1 AAA domain-containing protein [Chitinophaga skermanii]